MRALMAIQLAAILTLLTAASCSTTKRLGQDETLYTGVKKLEIKPTGKEKLPSEMVSDIKQTINVTPNNPLPFKLMSPYWRSPIPLGLWVYNNWNDSAKGIKGWLYRKLVEQPVLISDVRPEVRVKMIEEILDNNGYWIHRILRSSARQEKQEESQDQLSGRRKFALSDRQHHLSRR